MARDIEEFLRKAAERRQQQQGGGARQQKPPQQPSQRQPPQQQPPQRQPPRRQVPREPVIIDDVEIVEPRLVARPAQPKKRPTQKQPSSIRSGSVSDHVSSHINTSDIASHAEQLGDRISSVHDQVESRIHQRLDSDLTTLDDTRSVTEEPRKAIFRAKSSKAADDLRRLLSNPKSAAQAILVAEILRRPNIN